MAGLLDYITEAAKAQYAKGAPYRNALGGLLSGDMSALQELNKPSPVMPNEALDVAMTFAPMGITKAVGGKFPLTEFDVRQLTAQKNATLPINEGGLGLPATNTSMDRAKALGFDTDVYRGISPLTQELNQKDYALWAASNPTVANTYAGAEGGYVMPLKIKNNDLANIDYRGKEWDAVPYPAIVSYKNNDFIVPKENKKSLVSDSIGRFSKNLGSQGLKMENIVDFGLQKEGVNFNKLNDIEYGGVPVDSYVMFNPSNVRSRFASFDPFRRNEADILAGVGVGVPVASGLLDIEDKKVPKKENKKTK
jgi:hypothetical protein